MNPNDLFKPDYKQIWETIDHEAWLKDHERVDYPKTIQTILLESRIGLILKEEDEHL